MSIQNLYEQYLGRKADEGGLEYYRGQMQAGATLADVASQIRKSEEARAYAGNALQATAKQYLGRELETAGLASFLNSIAAGASLGEAVTAISTSPEAKLYAQNQNEAKLEAQRAEQRAFDQAGRDEIAAQNQAILGQQRAEMAQRMQMFKEQQEQARKDAERQARQMQIASAYGERDPADVRFSQSAAEKKKLLTAGTSGTFGRENLRIKGLNIKPSKGSSMASMASSFA
jgi:cell pole-organizing protein PopZ